MSEIYLESPPDARILRQEEVQGTPLGSCGCRTHLRLCRVRFSLQRLDPDVGSCGFQIGVGGSSVLDVVRGAAVVALPACRIYLRLDQDVGRQSHQSSRTERAGLELSPDFLAPPQSQCRIAQGP